MRILRLRAASVLLVLAASSLSTIQAQGRTATIPRAEFKTAFERFEKIEARSGTGEVHALSRDLEHDFTASMDTLLVATNLPAQPAQLVANKQHALPMRIGVPRPPEAGPALAVVQPFVKCAAFTRRDTGFEAELIVGLEDSDPHGTARIALDAQFSVLVTGGRAEPSDFKFDHVGQTQRVVLTVPAPGELVAIQIVAVVQRKNVPIDLQVPVQRPVVRVAVTPDSILGYGLGVATVLVQGDETTKDGDSVVLKTTIGTIEPTVVHLDANHVGTATLRSSGRGIATVGLALAEPGSSAPVSIAFTMPWFFVLMAICGGLFGTVLRLYSKDHRKTTRGSRRSTLRLVWTGTGLGALGAVLWALGLQVLPFAWAPVWSESAAFAVSAIVGILGSLHFPGSPGKE